MQRTHHGEVLQGFAQDGRLLQTGTFSAARPQLPHVRCLSRSQAAGATGYSERLQCYRLFGA